MNDKQNLLDALAKISEFKRKYSKELLEKKVLAEMIRDRAFGKIVVSWALEYIRQYLK